MFKGFNIDNIKVENVLCGIRKPLSANKILGANIISKSNWFFDFKNRTYETINLTTKIDKDKLEGCDSLEFYRKNGSPYITLEIGNMKIKNVLLEVV